MEASRYRELLTVLAFWANEVKNAIIYSRYKQVDQVT